MSAVARIGCVTGRPWIAAWIALLACALGLTIGPMLAAEPEPPVQGWASWEVPTVAGAPDWCCFDWQGGRSASGVCNLDSRDGGYGSRDQDRPVDSMRIHVRLEAGEVRQIRALGPRCQVKARTPVVDLGAMPADDSARWLARRIAPHTSISGDALAALAIHAGAVARDALVGVAKRDTSRENRKDAVFWIGQVRVSDAAADLEQIMFEDADPALREHAAFSLSQSQVPDRAQALIRLGKTDRTAKVRAQAWFWLAHTAAPESEVAIADALAREQDPHVREQAIFALSQLPEERAVAALAAIVQDPKRSREDRKQALFWLAQSESPRAQQYLEHVLTDSRAKTSGHP